MTSTIVISSWDIDRDEIDQLAEAGHLDAAQREDALRLAGVSPDAAGWQRFLSRLFLLLGITFMAAAVGYFVAFNWDELGRFAKIGLLELAVAVPALVAAKFAPDDLRGRAALLGTVLATGPLLAYIGQAYQTGADTYELFRAWALLTLPWALVARWRHLWCLWMLIANLSIFLYFVDAWRPLDGAMALSIPLVTHLVVNALFVLLLEQFASKVEGGGRSAERLGAALVMAATLGLYVLFLFDSRYRALWQPVLVAVAFACFWWIYRRRNPDLVVLALWCFHMIAAVVMTVAKLMFEAHAETSAFLLSGLTAIGLSAWAATWLRQVGRNPEAT